MYRMNLGHVLGRWRWGAVAFAAAIGVIFGLSWFYRDRTHEKTYRIGFEHSPPAQEVAPDGRPQGVIIDTIREAARRRNIRLEWRHAPKGPDAALRSGEVDLWPLMADLPQRRRFAYITEPYLRLTSWLVAREAEAVEPGRTKGRRVAVASYAFVARLAGSLLPDAKILPMSDQQSAMQALCRGETDVAFVVDGVGDNVLQQRAGVCRGLSLRVKPLDRGTVLFGLGAPKDDRASGQVADAIREELGRMSADGSFATISLNWSMLAPGQGKSLFTLVEYRNLITLLRFSLGVLLFLIAGLFWQGRRLRAAKIDADRANRAKSVFLAGMTHELRTPLNAILGFSQLMSRDPSLAPEHQANLGIINRSGEHLLRMINTVLDLAKVESGRGTLREAPFDIRRTLDELRDLFMLRAQEKNLALRIETTPDVPPCILGDEDKVRQILINLLGNAVKFTSRGEVVLRVSRAPAGGCALAAEVSDTGPGLTSQEIASLFEPFTQTEASQTGQYGTGLGLALSRQFARLMGGDLTAASRGAGCGAIFTLTMPLREAEPVQQVPPHGKALALEPGQPVWRLLVAEDHAESRLLLTTLLSRLGFAVREATDGASAVELWREWRPHLIWMDLQMPVLDGRAAARQIREDPGGAETTIVAVTANAFDEERHAILQVCDEFLLKPYQESEIVTILETRLKARFIRQPVAAAADPAPVAREFAALPDSIREELRRAIAQTDAMRIAELAGQLEDALPLAAAALQRAARAFDYEAVRRAIDGVSSP